MNNETIDRLTAEKQKLILDNDALRLEINTVKADKNAQQVFLEKAQSDLRILEAENAKLKEGQEYLEECLADKRELAKEISDILHPNSDGPKTPSLCDVVKYVRDDFAKLTAENTQLRTTNSELTTASWDDLQHEILGLKGAILGAKARLFHGGEVTQEMLETMQELAIRIHDVADRLEKANTKEIQTMNDKCVTIRRGLETAMREAISELQTAQKACADHYAYGNIRWAKELLERQLAPKT